jgi:hypothetical protein
MEDPINSHSKDFSEIAVKEAAFNGMIKSTKALAMLGANLLTDKYFRAKVDDEFNDINKSSEK